MRKLDDDLWIKDDAIRFFGVRIRTRMTVVLLDDEQLWLHSPVALAPRLRGKVDQLGEVRYIVAPNRYHHVYAGEWTEAYPDAELWGAPGLPEKRTDLTFDHVLTKGEPPWSDAIDQKFIDGISTLREVAFFHRKSETLIGADLFFNEHDPDSFLQKAYLWANGILGRPGISKLIKFATDDREALRTSMESLLAWDFTRIVISHGEVIDEDAQAVLQRVIESDL